jgi:hypothetical protein
MSAKLVVPVERIDAASSSVLFNVAPVRPISSGSAKGLSCAQGRGHTSPKVQNLGRCQSSPRVLNHVSLGTPLGRAGWDPRGGRAFDNHFSLSGSQRNRKAQIIKAKQASMPRAIPIRPQMAFWSRLPRSADLLKNSWRRRDTGPLREAHSDLICDSPSILGTTICNLAFWIVDFW